MSPSVVHSIRISNHISLATKTDSSGRNMQCHLQPYKLRPFEEVMMELDVENHTLNFTIPASQYTMGLTGLWPDGETKLWSFELRNLPKARYQMFAILRYGLSLRLKDFSIEQRSCSEIPRDVQFSCTHWIIRILLVVVWIVVDYKLNRYCHQIEYLLPKIIFTATLAFLLGIRYGINF